MKCLSANIFSNFIHIQSDLLHFVTMTLSLIQARRSNSRNGRKCTLQSLKIWGKIKNSDDDVVTTIFAKPANISAWREINKVTNILRYIYTMEKFPNFWKSKIKPTFNKNKESLCNIRNGEHPIESILSPS